MLHLARVLLIAPHEFEELVAQLASLSMPSASAWFGQEPCTFITTLASL